MEHINPFFLFHFVLNLVNLMKEESKASVFKWKGMLHNQSMLLSLKMNRYIDLTTCNS
jgi:hypothetical protein